MAGGLKEAMSEKVKGRDRASPVGPSPGGGSPCSVDVVLFDFGGVLADEGFVGGLAAIARKNGLDEESFVELGHTLVHETGFLTGRSEEAAYWSALRRHSGIRGSDRGLRREILSRFRLRPWLLRLVKAIRDRGIRVGILSDQTLWLDELNERHDFFRFFDVVFNSYHLGKSKRDPTHFDDIAGNLGVKPERVLFVDDNEGHIARARLRGWQTILYRNRSDFIRQIRAYCPWIERSFSIREPSRSVPAKEETPGNRRIPG